LPVTLSSTFYVHFTVMHVRCSPKKPYEQVRPAGAAVAPNRRGPTDWKRRASDRGDGSSCARAADAGPRRPARVQLQAGAVCSACLTRYRCPPGAHDAAERKHDHLCSPQGQHDHPGRSARAASGAGAQTHPAGRRPPRNGTRSALLVGAGGDFPRRSSCGPMPSALLLAPSRWTRPSRT